MMRQEYESTTAETNIDDGVSPSHELVEDTRRSNIIRQQPDHYGPVIRH